MSHRVAMVIKIPLHGALLVTKCATMELLVLDMRTKCCTVLFTNSVFHSLLVVLRCAGLQLKKQS